MGRNVKYDLLRGGSALFVMLYHYTCRYFEIFNETKNFTLFKYGFLGVPIFFILSGFLISRSFENESSLSNYFLKRFLRIYPTYISCMILTFLVTKYLFITERSVSNLDFILNFFIISDYIGGSYVDSAYWSLAIEVVFYLIAPILLNRRFLFAALVLISFLNIYISHYVFNVLTLFNWINFFYLGFQLHSKNFKYKSILYALIFFNIYEYFGAQYLVVSTVIFVIFKLRSKVYLPINIVKAIQFFADISFPLYLLHQNIGYYLIRKINVIFSIPYYFIIPLVVCALFLISYLVHITVENKFSYKTIYGK